MLYFCSLYFTMVKQYSSEEAGRQLLFFIPGIGSKWPKPRLQESMISPDTDVLGLQLA